MPTQRPNLDELIPDSRIQDDLLKILWEGEEEGEITLEVGIIKVPRSAFLEVISKSYRRNVYQIGFCNYYAAQVAIGGVKEQRSGILHPIYCFATLFYDDDKDLITIDVHPNMR